VISLFCRFGRFQLQFKGCTDKAIILVAGSRTHQMKRDEVLAILEAHREQLQKLGVKSLSLSKIWVKTPSFYDGFSWYLI